MDVFSSEKSIIEKGFLDKVLNILKDNKLIYEGILEKPKVKLILMNGNQDHNFYLSLLYLETIVIVH